MSEKQQPIETRWITGQDPEGNDATIRIELYRANDAYRWYGQDFIEGVLSAECLRDVEVSGVDVKEAVEMADLSWRSLRDQEQEEEA